MHWQVIRTIYQVTAQQCEPHAGLRILPSRFQTFFLLDYNANIHCIAFTLPYSLFI